MSVLRPCNGFEFRSTINADMIDMTKQNRFFQTHTTTNLLIFLCQCLPSSLFHDRWPVPKTEWLYACNDDEHDAAIMPDIPRWHGPIYELREDLISSFISLFDDDVWRND